MLGFLCPVSAEVLSFVTRSNLGAHVSSLVISAFVLTFSRLGTGTVLVCKDFSYGIIFELSVVKRGIDTELTAVQICQINLKLLALNSNS